MTYGTGTPTTGPAARTATRHAIRSAGPCRGLSGTVVLQDNGGDDLSVSANGPFTFAPRWPAAPATT